MKKFIKQVPLLMLSIIFFGVNTATAKMANTQTESEKRFYRNLDIKPTEMGAKEKNGTSVIFTHYTVKNKSKGAIKNLQWQIVYVADNQPVHYQSINLNFDEPYFKGKQQFDLEVDLELTELSENAKQQMIKPNVHISSYFVPKSITFAKNDFTIEVKKNVK